MSYPQITPITQIPKKWLLLVFVLLNLRNLCNLRMGLSSSICAQSTNR